MWHKDIYQTLFFFLYRHVGLFLLMAFQQITLCLFNLPNTLLCFFPLFDGKVLQYQAQDHKYFGLFAFIS